MAATTWADTRPDVGSAFDRAFKKWYPHAQSTSRQGSVRQDYRNVDDNGRFITIHPDDLRGHPDLQQQQQQQQQ